MPHDATHTLFQGLRNMAHAGVEAFAQQSATSGGKRKRRRAKKTEECSPCAAMDAVDQARARVKDGRL